MIKTGSYRRLNRETRKSWRLVRSDNGGNRMLGNKLGNCFENSEKLKYCFALKSKVGFKQVYLIFKRCFNQRDFILKLDNVRTNDIRRTSSDIRASNNAASDRRRARY